MLKSFALAFAIASAATAADANSIASFTIGGATDLNLNQTFNVTGTPTLVSGTWTVTFTQATNPFAVGSHVIFSGFTPSTFNSTAGAFATVQSGTTVGTCPSSVCTLIASSGSTSATYSSGGAVGPYNIGDTYYSTWCSDNNVYVQQNDGSGFGTYSGHVSFGVMNGLTTSSPPPSTVWGSGAPHWQSEIDSIVQFKGSNPICIGTGGTDTIYDGMNSDNYIYPGNAFVYGDQDATVMISSDHGVTWYPDPTTGGRAANPSASYGANLPVTAAVMTNGVETISYTGVSGQPGWRIGDTLILTGSTGAVYDGIGAVTVAATCVGTACTGLQFFNTLKTGSSSAAVGGSAVIYGAYAPASYTGPGTPATVTAPMWPGSDFGTPMFMEYGEGLSTTYSDGSCCSGTLPDNAGSFVYVYGGDSPIMGSTSAANRIYLARVPYGNGPGTPADISNLRAADYEYYCGGDGSTTSNWTYASTPGIVPTAAAGGGTGGSGRSACNAVPVMTDLNPIGAGPLGKLSLAGFQYIPPALAGGGHGGVYLTFMNNFYTTLQPTIGGSPWTYGYLKSGTLTAGAESVTFGCTGANFAAGETIAIQVASPAGYNTPGNVGVILTSETYNAGTGICTANFTNGASTATYTSGGYIVPVRPNNGDLFDNTIIAWQAPHPWGNGTGSYSTGTTVPWCKFEVLPGVRSTAWYLPSIVTPTISTDRTTMSWISANSTFYVPNLVPLTLTYNASSSGNLCGF